MSETTSRMVEAAYKAPQISEWEKHRETITQLYMVQNKTLREVKRYLQEHHGFEATERMFKVRIHQWNLKKYVKSEDKNINIMVRSGRAANHRLGNTAQSSGEPGSILLGQRQHYEEEKPVTKATANWRKLFAGMREKNFLSPPAGMITNTQEAQPIQGNEPQGGIECRSPIRSQLSSPPISTPFRACQGYQEPDPVGLPAPSHRPISSQAPTPKNSFYDYDEESDARRKRRKVSTINSTTPLETRTLACPFYKHNPLRYNPSTMRFRTCAGPGWDSISRLRQHLFRAHRCDPVGAKHYELHSFIKRGNSWEAHSAKIAGTEEELAKKASDRERNSLLLEPLRYMEPERRALIDGLLERKNLDRGSHEAQFRCLFVESFSPGQGKDGGQQSEKDERMDVIIAQQIISQAGSAPGELLLPFVSITQGQEQELKQKQPAKLNREEHWLRIYHILFPWDSSSPSPYYENGSEASMGALLPGPPADRVNSLVQHLCKTLPQRILTGMKGQPRYYRLGIPLKSPTGTSQSTVNDHLQQSFPGQGELSAEEASVGPQLSASAPDLRILISDTVTEACTEWLRNRNEEDDQSDQELAIDDEQNYVASTFSSKAYDIWPLGGPFTNVEDYSGRDSAIPRHATLMDAGGWSAGHLSLDQPQSELGMTEPSADLSLNHDLSSLNMDSNFTTASTSSYDFSYLPMSPGIPFLDPSAQLEWEPTASIGDVEEEPTNIFRDIEVEPTATSNDAANDDCQLCSFVNSADTNCGPWRGPKPVQSESAIDTTLSDMSLNPDP